MLWMQHSNRTVAGKKGRSETKGVAALALECVGQACMYSLSCQFLTMCVLDEDTVLKAYQQQ